MFTVLPYLAYTKNFMLFCMARRVCHYKSLQLHPVYGQVWQMSGQIVL